MLVGLFAIGRTEDRSLALEELPDDDEPEDEPLPLLADDPPSTFNTKVFLSERDWDCARIHYLIWNPGFQSWLWESGDSFAADFRKYDADGLSLWSSMETWFDQLTLSYLLRLEEGWFTYGGAFRIIDE